MAYQSLDEKLEALRHLKLELMEGASERAGWELDPHRPDLSISADVDDDQRAHATLSIGSLWGQQMRFVDLYPDEARELARHLTIMADAIDSIVDNHEPPDPPGFEAGFAANH